MWSGDGWRTAGFNYDFSERRNIELLKAQIGYHVAPIRFEGREQDAAEERSEQGGDRR